MGLSYLWHVALCILCDIQLEIERNQHGVRICGPRQDFSIRNRTRATPSRQHATRSCSASFVGRSDHMFVLQFRIRTSCVSNESRPTSAVRMYARMKRNAPDSPYPVQRTPLFLFVFEILHFPFTKFSRTSQQRIRFRFMGESIRPNVIQTKELRSIRRFGVVPDVPLKAFDFAKISANGLREVPDFDIRVISGHPISVYAKIGCEE